MDENLKNTKTILASILGVLPKEPDSGKHGFWTNGDIILCKKEEQAEAVADFLEELGICDATTGYYDPVEDVKNGQIDSCTGYYYIDC